MTEKLNYLKEPAKELVTHDEIEQMLQDSTLDFETKNHIIGFLSGVHQCIYNMLDTDNFEHTDQALLQNKPDLWGEGYNAIIQIFQKYHDCIQAENYERIYGQPFDDSIFGGITNEQKDETSLVGN